MPLEIYVSVLTKLAGRSFSCRLYLSWWIALTLPSASSSSSAHQKNGPLHHHHCLNIHGIRVWVWTVDAHAFITIRFYYASNWHAFVLIKMEIDYAHFWKTLWNCWPREFEHWRKDQNHIILIKHYKLNEWCKSQVDVVWEWCLCNEFEKKNYQKHAKHLDDIQHFTIFHRNVFI